VASKVLAVSRSAWLPYQEDPDTGGEDYEYVIGTTNFLSVTYSYDTEGKVTSVLYPGTSASTGGPGGGAGWFVLNYGFDSMGRPSR
jgi:hypothetical protein